MAETRVIHKWVLDDHTDLHALVMPKGAELLHVDLQALMITIWARVDKRAPAATRHLMVVATGETFREGWSYVGTVQMPNGLVWHVLDLGEVGESRG